MRPTPHENETRHEVFRAAGHSHTAPVRSLEKLDDARPHAALPPTARGFLTRLIEQQLLSPTQVDHFLEEAGESLPEYTEVEALGNALVESQFLTAYQLNRILAGTTHGLILGNYRVLDRLGAGSMGVVFLAEHLLMKRRAAIKVLPVDEDCSPALWERFCSEMQVLAALHHPNIVLAFDAGHVPEAGSGMPPLLYLVMELVSGGDLDQYVSDHGPVGIAQACDWIRQAACGLQEAHDHHLIHRDIKPSNLLLTAQQQVKVTDFGLVRQFSSRLTSHDRLLGTLECMAPEQCCDPSLVDGRADIYGLGATLLWLLTGEFPYPPAKSLGEATRNMQSGKPRRLRSLRPEAPEALETLIDRMLRLDPSERPALPLQVMSDLLPFLSEERTRVEPLVRRAEPNPPEPESPRTSPSVGSTSGDGPKRVLLVDDEASIRYLARSMLESFSLVCNEAADAGTALTLLQQEPFDLVLLDLNLPDMDGYQVCQQLREAPYSPYLKIIIVSGRGDQNQLSEALPRGADDYIAKPFGTRQLQARVEHALRLKAAQDQIEALTHRLVLSNRQLENSLAARINDVRHAEDALLFAMAKMAESKNGETAGHLRRLQRYTRCLAEAMVHQPSWEGVVNSAFLEQLDRCVPLHDIGMIAIPEHILLKPGKLSDEERRLMETHTVIGDGILEALGQEYGGSLVFLRMASAIVRHHHERYDGLGYPDGLAGEAIPAAARLVAVADVYDALRRRRFHKPALNHADATRIVIENCARQFDPAVLQAFQAHHAHFERIYRDIRT